MAETAGLSQPELGSFAGQDERPTTADSGSNSMATPQSEATLVVENMHCGGCMRSIEQTLNRLQGVADARSNLTTKRVTIHYRDTSLSEQDLIDALKGAGFTAASYSPSANSQSNEHERDFLSRLGVAGFAAANIMLLSVAVWAGSGSDMDDGIRSLFHWLSALIGLPAVAYAGQPFFTSALSALRARRLNMDVPISLGVTLAAAMSLYQTILGTEQVYFDAAVTLLFFLLVGRFLDYRMRAKAKSAAANLIGLQNTTATVVELSGATRRMPAHRLQEGWRIRSAAGERIAADGRVVAGLATDIDESLISGETLPRTANKGDRVYAGTINLTNPIDIEVTGAHENTLLSELARLMDAAEQGRGRYVRLADRAASIYAPGVHLLSLLTFVGWMIAGAEWTASLTTAIAVLIITCPCALALAVPAVQVAAAGRLFASGILLKSPDGLERLAEIDTIIFDKTGTLTLGEPTLIEADKIDDEHLARAASLASASRHPYACAIAAAAKARSLDVAPPGAVEETPGAGLKRTTPAGEERLGSKAWCDASGESHTATAAGTNQATTVWYRSASSSLYPFALRDSARADASLVISQIEKDGYTTKIISGDRQEPVAALAKHIGISDYVAEARPEQKIDIVNQLQQSGHKVLMVGDGLNDAPALAAGHASMSPSTAADISQATADVIFQGRQLRPIRLALNTAKLARTFSLQNFGIALGYNMIFVPLAVTGYVTPLIAAIAMSASSIAVTLNALRLRTIKRN